MIFHYMMMLLDRKSTREGESGRERKNSWVVLKEQTYDVLFSILLHGVFGNLDISRVIYY